MKNKSLFLITFTFATVFISQAGASVCPSLPKASQYEMKELLFNAGSDFKIVVSGKIVGKVIQRFFKGGKNFELQTVDGQIIATAKEQVFTWGTKLDIVDCQNVTLGGMQENVLQSLTHLETIYSILDGKNEVVGQSDTLDIARTDITFKNSLRRPVVELNRSLIRFFRDKWTVSVVNPADPIAENPAIFFAAAYKTAIDKLREADAQRSSNSQSVSQSSWGQDAGWNSGSYRSH